MTIPSLPQDPTAILSEVESFFDALPATRRRKRTHAEIYEPDQSEEGENYGPEPEPTIVIELDGAALATLSKLLFQLGKARNDALAQVLLLKILDTLGLELEGGK